MLPASITELFQKRFSAKRAEIVSELAATLRAVDDACAGEGSFNSGARPARLADAIAESNSCLMHEAWALLQGILEGGGVGYNRSLATDLKSIIAAGSPRNAGFRSLESEMAGSPPQDFSHLRASLEKRLASVVAEIDGQIDLHVLAQRTKAMVPWYARRGMPQVIVAGLFIIAATVLAAVLESPWGLHRLFQTSVEETTDAGPAHFILTVKNLNAPPEASSVTLSEITEFLWSNETTKLQKAGFRETHGMKLVTWSGVIAFARDTELEGDWAEVGVTTAPFSAIRAKFLAVPVYFPPSQRPGLMDSAVGDTVRFRGLLVFYGEAAAIEIHDAVVLHEEGSGLSN